MRVFVSTEETQGRRKNDFCFVPEGELLMFGVECTGEKPDDSCGCARSLVGFVCRAATTTIKVVERELTEDSFVEQFKSSITKAWGDRLDITDAQYRQEAMELLTMASPWPTGTVLERRGETFIKREIA